MEENTEDKESPVGGIHSNDLLDFHPIGKYFALKIYENGIWVSPNNWMVDEKWIPMRMQQLIEEGHEVKVLKIHQYETREDVTDIYKGKI